MKALVVKTSSMGDVIHTLAALTDAMNALPGIRFDWVVEETFAEIPSWHPAVDRVIPVALRRWRKAPIQTWRGGQWHDYLKLLQSQQYDAVIDAQGLLKSALFVTRLARGKRYGLAGNSAREPIASMLYDRRIAVTRDQHAVERVRQLFAEALGYPIPHGSGDFAIAGHFPRPRAASYLVFLHATTRRDKHWPDAYWARLVKLAAGANWPIRLLWNTQPELERARFLADSQAHVTVMPRLSLTQAAATLAGAAGLVSVDTGLSHLAAALGRPNIILFGPTDPGLVGGYGPNQICLKAGDFQPPPAKVERSELAALTPDIVWERLTKLLGRSAEDEG